MIFYFLYFIKIILILYNTLIKLKRNKMENDRYETSGKYSKERVNGRNSNNNKKKSEYASNPIEKHFNEVVTDVTYSKLDFILFDLVSHDSNNEKYVNQDIINDSIIDNDSIFKDYLRTITRNDKYVPQQLIYFIEDYKIYVDSNIELYSPPDIEYTRNNILDVVLNKFIICGGNFYPYEQVLTECHPIMIGLHVNLLKYFFEKEIGHIDTNGYIIDSILEFSRLNKRNKTGEYLFEFTSLEGLLDCISDRFKCANIIDKSKYNFHQWTVLEKM
jgi:hypothetical protein